MHTFSHSKSSVDLTSAPINPTWILRGTPIARNAELSRSADGTAATMLWECTPGEFEWHYNVDETMQLLEGNILLDVGLPTERRIRPGDVVFFPAGSKVHWRIDEHVRKLAFLRRPLPHPLVRVIRFMRTMKQAIKKIQSPKNEPQADTNPLTI